jgi:hypothetical protein
VPFIFEMALNFFQNYSLISSENQTPFVISIILIMFIHLKKVRIENYYLYNF